MVGPQPNQPQPQVPQNQRGFLEDIVKTSAAVLVCTSLAWTANYVGVAIWDDSFMGPSPTHHVETTPGQAVCVGAGMGLTYAKNHYLKALSIVPFVLGISPELIDYWRYAFEYPPEVPEITARLGRKFIAGGVGSGLGLLTYIPGVRRFLR